MINAGSRASVRPAEISVGKPLLWSVYDADGNLLLKSGYVIESQNQIEALSKNGFFRDARWDGVGSRRVEAPGTGAPEEVPEATKETLVSMEDVRWRIGESLYLQPHDNPTLRYTVRLIGFVKNKTVMVTAPTLDGKFGFIRDGQTFVVRSFSGKKAYAFTAAAVKSVHAPYPYLHMSYPQQVRATAIRKGSRAAVKIIASVSLGQPARTIATTLIDLSVGGASGIAKQAFGVKGEEGQIKFKLHVAEHTAFLNLKTTLRSVTLAESGDVYNHGFEFLEVPVDERMILSAFVHQALAEAD
jgi:c-di-GMP-binding flagellar brake protein YcgR